VQERELVIQSEHKKSGLQLLCWQNLGLVCFSFFLGHLIREQGKAVLVRSERGRVASLSQACFGQQKKQRSPMLAH
jgi:hypothetical protein